MTRATPPIAVKGRPERVTARIATGRALGALVAGIVAAGCTLDATALCEAAGGTYVAATCIRWSPGQQAAQDGCEANGGVYQGGEDTCEFGMGGP